ncbi:hypothetical protein Rs2_48477 [Raphanus sativus]|nr:hypothetical protein Rs2_48477 [Raphanus sativus]
MVSPSSVTPSRRVTRSQSASDREPNPKKTCRVGKTAPLYADKPLRFSLREFGDITGLKCEPEREKVGNVSESSDATPGRMWKELFGTDDKDVTVADVLRMLEQPSLPEWKRLPLALIALVDGLLICGHKPNSFDAAYVEMLEDTQSFLQYPWGREAFASTLSRLTPPQPSDPSKMDKSLSVMRLRLKSSQQRVMGSLWRCNFLLLKLSPHCLRKFINLIKRLLSWKNLKDATQQIHF